MKIIIAGGGIGGLVTALSLHRIGVDVSVYESVDEVKPLGVGINLLPHSVRILSHLGLQEKVEAISVETKELVYANRLGQVFWNEPRGRFAGYRWPQFSVHRGMLQLLLWTEASQVLGKNHVQTGCHLSAITQDDDKVSATFTDKKGNSITTIDADILIGADGINSALRKILYPEEGGVVYSGNVLYRGTALMKPFLSGGTMAMIGSMDQKMVVYPIGKTPDENGLQLINWVANIFEGDKAQLTVRDWNRQVGKEKLLERYKNWRFNWMDVPEMIDNTNGGIFEFPMSDRNPLDRWSFGRVTLLGDAAHAMYPIGSNGASQAILDADALARALQSEKDPVRALEIYDAERVPATARVVLQNRQKGPDIIMDMMEERFPKGFSPNEIPHHELAQMMEHYKKIAGFDIDTLNAKS
jgi:2-polyprenyl-6-methoxyphenol hydroxylase-like FAD-dependent oxidoreductase